MKRLISKEEAQRVRLQAQGSPTSKPTVSPSPNCVFSESGVAPQTCLGFVEQDTVTRPNTGQSSHEWSENTPSVPPCPVQPWEQQQHWAAQQVCTRARTSPRGSPGVTNLIRYHLAKVTLSSSKLWNCRAYKGVQTKMDHN